MSKLLIVTIIFLIAGISMIFFTFFYSNTQVFYNHFKVPLSAEGGVTVLYKGSPGDRVVLVGYSNYTIKILEDIPPGRAIFLGNYTGNFSVAFTELNSRCISFEGTNCPANVIATIIVYNTSFSPLGYTISGILLGLGLILLGYYIALNKRR